ncbi:unnamed protein product [Heligmosomoides polygyrus]|uniref:Uncharacterized protein n=1 Tax=Heligmosomoides polygyrus TaxID=6339 RepID=A0A183FJH3_HELPZ|nr:unnamed protein product [Heligmosomoides polygyrus]
MKASGRGIRPAWCEEGLVGSSSPSPPPPPQPTWSKNSACQGERVGSPAKAKERQGRGDSIVATYSSPRSASEAVDGVSLSELSQTVGDSCFEHRQNAAADG